MIMKIITIRSRQDVLGPGTSRHRLAKESIYELGLRFVAFGFKNLFYNLYAVQTPSFDQIWRPSLIQKEKKLRGCLQRCILAFHLYK